MDNIWKPQTFIFNSASGDGFLPYKSDSSYVEIFSNGNVNLLSPAISLQTRCTLKLRKYPFDNQTCNFTIIPWPISVFSSPNIFYEADTSSNNQSNVNHPVWNIGSIKTFIGNFTGISGIPPINLHTIYIQFSIERQILYYVINSIIPCEILNIIIMIAFFIPFANQMALS